MRAGWTYVQGAPAGALLMYCVCYMPFNYTLFKYSDRRELAHTHALNDEDAIARLSEEARIPPLEACGDDPSAEFYVDRSDPNAPRDQPVRIWLKRRVS
jgi:hypothetical protein